MRDIGFRELPPFRHRRGAAAPSFVTLPTITGQPLVGVPLHLSEFTYSGAASVQVLVEWRVDGVALVGNTPADADFDKVVSAFITLANGVGDPATTEVFAALPVGKVFSEDWAARAAGDTFTELDAVYDRTSTSIGANLVADVDAPAGLAMVPDTGTSSNLRIWRTDLAAFAATYQAAIDYSENLLLIQHVGDNGSRHHFKALGAGLSATLPGVMVYAGAARLQVDGESENSNVGTLLANLTPGVKYWVRTGWQGTTVRAKVWAFGTPEPSAWTERTSGTAIAVYAHAVARRFASAYPATAFRLLYQASGFNAPAPYWPGFVVPAPSTADLLTFAAPGDGSSISAMDGAFVFGLSAATTPQVGRFAGGNHYALIPAGGVSVNDSTPAAGLFEGDKRNGMQAITSLGPFVGGAGPNSQGYDERTDNFGGNAPLAYDNALNIGAGNTGSAYVVTAPQVLIKAKSLTDAEVGGVRDFLAAREPVFFLASAPATDSLPPAIGAPSLIPDMTVPDIDFDLPPSLAPVAGGPAALTLLTNWRRLTLHETHTIRPPGDYYAGRLYENYYASAQAILTGQVLMAINSAIDTTIRQNLMIHTVIKANNIEHMVASGALYNTNGGLGGILAGAKPIVVMAAALTGKARFVDLAERTDVFAEDRQVRYITQAEIDAYNYDQIHLGMPDWDHNPVLDPGKNTVFQTDTYEAIFHRHAVGVVLPIMLTPGAKALWNNNAVFDYIDRTMERYLFPGDTGTYQWARTLTGTNAPTVYQKACWDTYRTSAGMPAVWDWPA